jgi:hypothetical protein
VHSDLDAGVVTSHGAPWRRLSLTGWPTACPAAEPRRSRLIGTRCAWLRSWDPDPAADQPDRHRVAVVAHHDLGEPVGVKLDLRRGHEGRPYITKRIQHLTVRHILRSELTNNDFTRRLVEPPMSLSCLSERYPFSSILVRGGFSSH